MLRPTIAILIAASVSTLGYANDSVFSLGIGGIVFEELDTISMVSENLRIGQSRVSVDYVFANQTDSKISANVGFPLPTLTLGEEPRFLFGLQSLAAPEPQFITLIDGVVVASTPLMRVTLRESSGAIDITEILRQVDLLPQNYAFLPDEAAIARQADRLTAAAEKHSLSDLLDDWQRWQYQLTYTWQLELAARQQVSVHHEYAPIYGGEALYPNAMKNRGELASRLEAFCPTADQLEKIWRSSGPAPTDHAGYFFDVDYILSTGGNWAGPIGEFQLTLDTETEGGFPILCWDGELTRVSPTQWTATEAKFVPTKELKVGFFMPHTSPASQ